MKLRIALNEITLPSTFEKFADLLNRSIDENEAQTFTNLIHSAFTAQKYDWVGRFYEMKDDDKNLSKKIFKALNF